MQGIKKRKGKGVSFMEVKSSHLSPETAKHLLKRHSGHQSLDWHEEGTFGMHSRIADVSFITVINNVTRNVYEII